MFSHDFWTIEISCTYLLTYHIACWCLSSITPNWLCWQVSHPLGGFVRYGINIEHVCVDFLAHILYYTIRYTWYFREISRNNRISDPTCMCWALIFLFFSSFFCYLFTKGRSTKKHSNSRNTVQMWITCLQNIYTFQWLYCTSHFSDINLMKVSATSFPTTYMCWIVGPNYSRMSR